MSQFVYPTCPDKVLFWIRQEISCPLVEAARDKVDAIHLAAEIGRLDILSIILGVFSIAIGTATIIGFWFYRGVVESTTKKELVEIFPDVLPKFFRENQHLLVAALKEARPISELIDNGEEKDFSQEIAESIDPRYEDTGE